MRLPEPVIWVFERSQRTCNMKYDGYVVVATTVNISRYNHRTLLILIVETRLTRML